MAVFLIPSVFTGCANTMSVEEAKKISVSMTEVTEFKPPPRRIDDILAILDKPGQFESRITEKFVAQADQKPPETTDPEWLKSFYRDRGEAAFELARYMQSKEDFERALGYGIRDELDGLIKQRLGVIENNYGNFQKAIEYLKDSTSYGPVRGVFNPVIAYRLLARLYATTGDLDAAIRTRQEGERVCGNPRMRPEGRFVCDRDTSLMYTDILGAEGKYSQAEEYFLKVKRLGLGPGRKFIENNPQFYITVDLNHAQNLFNLQRFLEAEVELRNVLLSSIAHAGRDSGLTALALVHMSRVLQARGRLEEAKLISEATLRILQTAGVPADSRTMALARMTKGDVLALTDDYKNAMSEYDLARTSMKENKFLYERTFMQNPTMLLTVLMAGRHQEAEELASMYFEKFRTRFGDKHENTAEMLALRGMAREKLNHLREAVRDLSAATDLLMVNRAQEEEFAKHKKLRRVIVDDYIGLLSKIRGTPC